MFVEIFILLFDLAFTSLITYFLFPVGHGYHYYVPFLLLIAGYVIGLALMWGILSLFALPLSKEKKYDKPLKHAQFLLTDAISYICFHARVKLRIHGNKNLPKERYLLVCNHRSKFDPMLIATLYGKKGLSFISKPTNFKIPLGGHFMKASCYLPIDRYDKLKSLEVMNEAIDLINRNQVSIGVFPEGTRYDDNELHHFHEGVFSIAKKTNCPIVITSIKGTENIHVNFPKRRTVVDFNIIEILEPEQYKDMIVKNISDYAYNKIKESLE